MNKRQLTYWKNLLKNVNLLKIMAYRSNYYLTRARIGGVFCFS